jgi:Mrp family chromosome partitioning ATPase
MSKNYELMQETELRLKLQSIPLPKADVPPPSARTKRRNGGGVRSHSKEQISQEETFKLVQNVFLLQGEVTPRVVVFAGIDSGNGCSEVCADAARKLASQKVGSVCLVDANLRAPSLPDYFGVSNHFGLTDALSRQGEIRDFTKVIGPNNLSLLSCGSLANQSQGLLTSEIMKIRISELRKEFDFVLIDSPPLNKYSDGVTLGQLADGLVLILEANVTRREAASKITDNLRASQIKVLGAVLNKRTYPIPRALYDLL